MVINGVVVMKKKECHLIPDEEKQCVWMTTGLIAYKLCTLDFRCEECLFDQVMRNEAPAGSRPDYYPAVSSAGAATTESFGQIKGSLFYHQHHCWAKVENPDEVRIGIDGILAQLVAKIKTVVLPKEGDEVKQGQCFAHLIQERHIVPLISPLSGSVLSINNGLKKYPELVGSDPWEGGWLITIQPANLETDVRVLLYGRRAMEWYQKREQEVSTAGAALLNQSDPCLGPTMQDGGERVNCLASVLPSEQYYQILESLCRAEDIT
jgi:glycine cleavage system H protein